MKRKSIIIALTLILLSSNVVKAEENNLQEYQIQESVEILEDNSNVNLDNKFNDEILTEGVEIIDRENDLYESECLERTEKVEEDKVESDKQNEEYKDENPYDEVEEKHVGWYLNPQTKLWYYYDQSGNMKYDWQYINGKWYYLDKSNHNNPGAMLYACKAFIGENYYFFDKSGAMLTSWVKREEGWYYTNKSGKMLTGWQSIGNKWYYLDEENQENSGLMLENCVKEINGKEYTFLGNGAMRAGWIFDNASWYYYDTYSGEIISGWKKIDSIWYYFNPDNENKMLSNTWDKIGGKWYYFNSDGSMKINWSIINSKWYYFGNDGGARTGWQIIGDKWYYFYKANDIYGSPECSMACNTKIEGYQISASGAMLPSEQASMLAKAQSYSSSSKYLILVNRNTCKVGIYTGKKGKWKESKYWNCSPGKPSTPTISGKFKVGAKGHYFDSGVARCYWYTQFKGDYLFHSVLYRKNGTLYDGRLGMKLSHGCVRLEIGNAKWIYDNVPRGTTVIVY